VLDVCESSGLELEIVLGLIAPRGFKSRILRSDQPKRRPLKRPGGRRSPSVSVARRACGPRLFAVVVVRDGRLPVLIDGACTAAMLGRNQPMIFTAWPDQPRHHLWRVQEVLRTVFDSGRPRASQIGWRPAGVTKVHCGAGACGSSRDSVQRHCSGDNTKHDTQRSNMDVVGIVSMILTAAAQAPWCGRPNGPSWIGT
jgi:hypothetical protein